MTPDPVECCPYCGKERPSGTLYTAIVDAERAAQRAHNLSYAEPTPIWMRMALGRAQSILMHYVVKHARSNEGGRG